MQVSQIVRALPVVLCLAAPPPVAAQGRYRVTNDGESFYLEPSGRRLARLARGAIVGGGVTRGDWMQVTIEGWIFATSVGPSPRPEFDLVVTKAPDENLRSSAGGALVAKLAEGFGLKKVGQDDRWVHVTRDGWVQTTALAILPDVIATRTVTASDTVSSEGGLTPGRRPGVDSTPTVPARQQPARPTTLYRAPDGPEAGTVTAETPLRVLGRTGEWARVQIEAWVKATDVQAAPPGVQVGVSAAELRAEPQRYFGQVLRWTLQYIAVQKADDLRPDIPAGATYVLARGPLPERGFVYVIVPDGKLASIQALAPLATIQVTARVRQGRSRFLGNPVVELISLEASP